MNFSMKQLNLHRNILATVRILPDKTLPEPLLVLNYPSKPAYLHFNSHYKTHQETDIACNDLKMENTNTRDDYGVLNRNDHSNNDDDDSEIKIKNYNDEDDGGDDDSEIKIKNDNIYIENELKSTKDAQDVFKKSKSKKVPSKRS